MTGKIFDWENVVGEIIGLGNCCRGHCLGEVDVGNYLIPIEHKTTSNTKFLIPEDETFVLDILRRRNHAKPGNCKLSQI